MPKVKSPLFSMEARGGLQGLVFNTWRGISTVKSNPSPFKGGTQKRLVAQALLLTAARAWQGLLDTDRALWNQYATDHPVSDPINGTKRLTGMNWYCNLSVQLARMGVPPVDTPPVGPAPDAVVGLALADAAGDLTIDWSAPTAAGYLLDIAIVGPVSQGITAKIERARFLVNPLAAAATPLIIITGAAIGRYTVFVRVFDMATGQSSSVVSAFVDIA